MEKVYLVKLISRLYKEHVMVAVEEKTYPTEDRIREIICQNYMAAAGYVEITEVFKVG